MTKYELVCGMEIHVELKTLSKMFCACKNDPFGAPKPNIYTCPVCLGLPGGLPVANKKAIAWTIKLGLALGCKINLFSKFDRKNYFYPDLAKGYQISQFDYPFCYDGKVETSEGPVRIERIHLEEDTGKLLHQEINGKKVSLIDFNRSGVALIEIVTKPDIISANQAKEYGRKIRQLLRYLDIADADMERGGMRLEANISVRPEGLKSLPNYKVEVKNINSFRFVEGAIEHEIKRHTEILESGSTPVQETRGWNSQKNETFSQRIKESAEEYRYFPDPDLPPMQFTQQEIDEIGASLPELPDDKVERWKKEYAIEVRFAETLTQNKEKADRYEEVFKLATKNSLKPNEVAKAIINKKISVTQADATERILEKYQELTKTDEVDEGKLAQIIDEIIKENEEVANRFRAGEEKLLGFFMGQVARKLAQKIDPQLLKNALEKQLK